MNADGFPDSNPCRPRFGVPSHRGSLPREAIAADERHDRRSVAKGGDGPSDGSDDESIVFGELDDFCGGDASDDDFDSDNASFGTGRRSSTQQSIVLKRGLKNLLNRKECVVAPVGVRRCVIVVDCFALFLL